MHKFLLILFILLPLFEAYADDRAQIKDIRHYTLSNGVRLIIETSGFVDFNQGQLRNPERLFFDINNAFLNRELKREILIGKEPVQRVRFGQFSSNVVRVVFDLTGSDYQFRVILLEDPFRIVIDVYNERTKESLKEQVVRGREGTGKKGEQRLQQELKGAKKLKVVLDPGHGGKDPGAIGPTGLMEKDVVLDIALKVKDLLDEEPNFEVVLTRDRDIYLTLNERTDIANKFNADVFISIHTNASHNPLARGVETYLLNWTDDEEAIRVAARENAISVSKMKQLKGELGTVLASLEREAKRDDSVKLAGYLHSAISEKLKSNFSRNDNGLKQALFYVLVGAQMPSCLLEISYISNPEEEKLLANEFYRLKIAQTIAEGIKDYFNKTERHYKVKYTNKFLVRDDSKDNKKSKSTVNNKKTNNKQVKAKKL